MQRLGILENPQILRVLDSDEMDIPEIGTGVDGDKNKENSPVLRNPGF